MDFITIFSFGLLGLVIGSFLNAAVYRLRIKQFKSIFLGRSFCVHCKKTLQLRDLIPLLSFLLLGGKCRFCSQKISAHYFWVEFITAVTFSLVAGLTGLENIPLLIWNLFFVTVLIFLASFDAQFGEIPDEVSLPAILIATLGSFFTFMLTPSQSLLGVIVGGGFFVGVLLLNELAYRLKWTRANWMGGGDVRLGLLLGALFGWQGFLIALFIASVSGSVFGLTQIALQKRDAKTPLPFGPFLVLGGIVTLLFGGELWGWYEGFL